MAQSHKVLGQTAVSSTATFDLYTVPASTEAVISTIGICNRGVSANYRIAVRPAGASIEDKHFLVYDASVNANDSAFLTLGVSMAATDVLTVAAGNTHVSFSAFGVEIT